MRGVETACLWVATTNPGKAEEAERLLRAGVAGARRWLRIRHLGELPPAPPPEETGATYGENARLKAVAASARVPPTDAVLADDSGIEIDALGGRPGLQSARWGAPDGGMRLSDRQLNELLLRQLRGVPGGQRSARMVAAVVLRLPDGSEFVGHGVVEGYLAEDIRGGQGFGFDSIFCLPDGRRLSEVSAQDKDAISHRGQAVRSVLPALRRWLDAER